MFLKMLTRLRPGTTPFPDWCSEYERLIDLRDLHKKTKGKRKGNVAHLRRALGEIGIGSVRPLHIASTVHALWASGRHNTARRVLLEARDMFGAAVAAGLISANPAASIKPLPVKVRRRRLRLDEWQALYDEAQATEPPWMSRMLALALVSGQRRADMQKMLFSDVHDGYLFLEQQKTGERIALPLKLRLDVIGVTLGEVINSCRNYALPGETLLRKHNGKPFENNYLSARFRDLFLRVFGPCPDGGARPTLHECRSLSERLYRKQGVDTKTLLGHKSQIMTDKYNDDRGLGRCEYKFLII